MSVGGSRNSSHGRWCLLPGLLLGLLLALGTLLGAAAGQRGVATRVQTPRLTSEECLACHGDPEAKGASGRSVAVSEAPFAASVHGQSGIGCVDCHADLAATDLPHAEKAAPVECATCHDAAAGAYRTSIHAAARQASAASVAATCVDCHGTHDIRSSKDPDSRTYHLTLPATCGRCHGDPEIIGKGRIAAGNVAAAYDDSIHGRAVTRSGLLVAPACSDCHSAHDIRRKSDPASPVHRTAIPATCGKCHQGVERLYRDSVHGAELGKGNVIAPVCASCHSAHDVQRADSDSWKLQVIQECGTCHKQSIRTYRDTFHGQVTALGFVRVAKCADCHGAHDIHRSTDPRALVSDRRRQSTCQRCHSGVSASFARYDPHADRYDRERNPTLYYAARFMDVLLFGVFSFFGLHALLWLSRTVGHRRRPEAAEPPAEPPAATDATE